MNNKGISMVSLVITIIVIILLAAISINSGMGKHLDEANKAKFQNELKNAVTAVEIYHNRAAIHGISSYESDELSWDGVSEKAENTAKMEDENHIEEDSINYIFEKNITDLLKGIITIENGKVKVDKTKKPQIDWAVELYKYMEE